MRIEALIAPTTWAAMKQAAITCERTGFDALAVPEIKGDSLIHAATIASATERAQIRTAITIAFARSPMVVANAAWDIHTNSGGRFALGLGTQVKAHNERRFSVPWSAPAARLREYVESLRAIFRCYEHGEALAYRGEHYRFSLMTPEFAPKPTGLPPIPIYTAAVRPAMVRMSASVADGVRLHGFCTRRYQEEVIAKEIEQGLAEAGRARETFEVCGGGFIITAKDEADLAAQREAIRYRVAFYGSTPSYRPVLSLHGWDDLGEKLHKLSVTGKWKEMAAAVSDEVLSAFLVEGTHAQLASRIAERFGGLTDSVELGTSSNPLQLPSDLLEDLRAIPAKFTGQPRAT
jgi:probable F420-dependent oxidoreductase